MFCFVFVERTLILWIQWQLWECSFFQQDPPSHLTSSYQPRKLGCKEYFLRETINVVRVAWYVEYGGKAMEITDPNC